MSLARSVVSGLAVGLLAGFAVALLRPRQIGSTQPVATPAPAGRRGRDAPTGPRAPSPWRPAGTGRRLSVEAIH